MCEDSVQVGVGVSTTYHGVNEIDHRQQLLLYALNCLRVGIIRKIKKTRRILLQLLAKLVNISLFVWFNIV